MGNNPAEPSASHGSDFRRMLPGLLVSAAALGIIFYFTDLEKFQAAVLLADYRLVLLAVITTMVWLVVRSYAWRTLLQKQAPVWPVFWAVNQGYLLNNMLPFRMGEFGRAYLLSRKVGLSFWQVFSTILIERLLDLGLAVVLLFATLPFVIGATWAREVALVLAVLVMAGLVGLFAIARNRVHFEKFLSGVSRRWQLFASVEKTLVKPALDGLSVLADGWLFLRALSWFLLNWVVAIVQYIFMVRAFFPSAPILWGAFCLGVAALGVAAPASPGSVGVFEGAVVAAMVAFGQDPSTGLALAITLHLVQIILTGIFGSIALGRDGESLIGLFNQVRKLANR